MYQVYAFKNIKNKIIFIQSIAVDHNYTGVSSTVVPTDLTMAEIGALEQRVKRLYNPENCMLKQDVFVKHNAPDNSQFQRRPRSQGQLF